MNSDKYMYNNNKNNRNNNEQIPLEEKCLKLKELENYLNWCEMIPLWVSTEILMTKKRNRQTMMIELFIDVVSELYKARNVNGMIMVLTGMYVCFFYLVFLFVFSICFFYLFFRN